MSAESSVPGVVLGYRRGSGKQYVGQVYVKVLANVSPHSLVGRKVRAVDAHGNAYLGRVLRVHGTGRNGVVIAVFSRNVPGQLIGSEVSIL